MSICRVYFHFEPLPPNHRLLPNRQRSAARLTLRHIYLHFENQAVRFLSFHKSQLASWGCHRYTLRRGVGDLADKLARDTLVIVIIATLILAAGMAWSNASTGKKPRIIQRIECWYNSHLGYFW